MSQSARIALLRASHQGNRGELAAAVAGREVYFRYFGLDRAPAPTGDPFAVAATVECMTQGQPLTLDAGLPLSPRLLTGLRDYQQVYRAWFPDLGEVDVRPATLGATARGHGVACFYSGGVDSAYALLRNVDRLSHLVLVRGLDIPMAEVDRWQRTRRAVERIAERHGLRLVLVETNVQDVLRSRVYDNHGAILISTALGLGFGEVIVPASIHVEDLYPWGSHPVTDPLLATDATWVTQDSPIRRIFKVRGLIEADVDLTDLRVCNRYSDYNCGTCEKCLRTRVPFEVLGARSAALPGPVTPALIDRITLWDGALRQPWRDNRDLARANGREDLARACDRLLERYERRELWKAHDARWLGGRLRRLMHAWRARRALRPG